MTFEDSGLCLIVITLMRRKLLTWIVTSSAKVGENPARDGCRGTGGRSLSFLEFSTAERSWPAWNNRSQLCSAESGDSIPESRPTDAIGQSRDGEKVSSANLLLPIAALEGTGSDAWPPSRLPPREEASATNGGNARGFSTAIVSGSGYLPEAAVTNLRKKKKKRRPNWFHVFCFGARERRWDFSQWSLVMNENRFTYGLKWFLSLQIASIQMKRDDYRQSRCTTLLGVAEGYGNPPPPPGRLSRTGFDCCSVPAIKPSEANPK